MPSIYRYIKPCSTYQSYAYGALFSPAPLSDFGSPFLDADLALASSLTKKVILPLGLAPKRHEIRRENPWVDIVDKPLSTGNEATKTEESRLEYGPSFPPFFWQRFMGDIAGLFPKNFVIFLNSTSSAAALVLYLPGVCTQSNTEGKQRVPRVLWLVSCSIGLW